MKSYLIFATLLLITSCSERKNEDSKETSIKLETLNQFEYSQKIDEIHNELDKSSQFFSIPSNKLSIIKGKKGTVLYINPDDLILENGNKITKELKVELKELTSTRDLFFSNAQTVSNDKILVSGGAYFIKITSDNETVKIKTGKTLMAEFPKLQDENMSIFYGQRDSASNINWTNTGNDLKKKYKTIEQGQAQQPKKDKYDETDEMFDYLDGVEGPHINEKTKKNLILEEKVYEAFDIEKLGWINVDRFLKFENKTNLKIEFDINGPLKFAKVYIVFEDINSVITEQYSIKHETETISNLPVGQKIKFIILTVENEKILAHVSDEVISNNHKIKVNLKETNLETVKNFIK